MDRIFAKYWEGRTPPSEYYILPDPYNSCPESNINLRKLCQYAKVVGKSPADLTYEDVQQFANKES